jgi:single-strand DNA-binding protein
MTTTTASSTSSAGEEPVHVNEVRLVGRVSADPAELTLPSGDTLWTFRLVVDRPGPSVGRGRQLDTLDCAVWSGRVKRSVPTWRQGDLVEVTGAIRRRFYAAGAAKVSRYQVEVTGGRVIRRAASG